MNKKVAIVLVIIIMLLIPITILAGTNIIEKIKVVPEQPDPIVPDKNVTTSEYSYNLALSTDDDLTEKLAKAEKENEAKKQKIEAIIKKFSSEEYEQLKEEASEVINSADFNDNGYFDKDSPFFKLYNLVLNIIEYENLTDDELTTLKDFMIDEESNIHNQPELVNRIEKLCR